MRVLVVEDEVKMAALVRRGLEREGYAVDVARDGDEALWAAREQDYDAIVLDAMIPEPGRLRGVPHPPGRGPVGARADAHGPRLGRGPGARASTPVPTTT